MKDFRIYCQVQGLSKDEFQAACKWLRDQMFTYIPSKKTWYRDLSLASARYQGQMIEEARQLGLRYEIEERLNREN